MDRLGKLPTALISVFAVLLAIILADVVYFLWRRRSLQRRTLGEDQPLPADLFYAPSKELLYFFCWKNQSRVKPDSALPPVGSSPDRQAEAVDELEKWQRLYGPSRLLFTIKEEDREGSDHSDYSSSAEKGRKTRPVSADDGFGFVLGTLPEVSVAVDEVDEVTPFSTPCASPPYYTPSPSPPRDVTNEGGDMAEV